jgi:hypothetical protein
MFSSENIRKFSVAVSSWFWNLLPERIRIFGMGALGDPPPPILVSPVENQMLQNSTATFEWQLGQGNPQATSFTVWVGVADQPFNQAGAEIYQPIAASARSFTPPNDLPLRFQGKYLKWSVASCAPNTRLPRWRGAGAIVRCTYAIPRALIWPLPAPVLSNLSGAVPDFRPTFNWQPVVGADYYLLCVSRPGVACPTEPTDAPDTLVVKVVGTQNTSWTPSSDQELSRFTGQPADWTVAAVNASFLVWQNQGKGVTFPSLPLSFVPAALNVVVDATQNATIHIGTRATFDLRITLVPLNQKIAIDGHPAGSQVVITIRRGADARAFSVTGVHGGNSNITASAIGYQAATMNVTVVAPSFSLEVVAPTQRTVNWGQPADYQVMVHPQNGYAGMVTLAVCSPPLTPSHPPTFTPNPVNAGQTSTLTVHTIDGGTNPGVSALTVRGQDTPSSQRVDPCSSISVPSGSAGPLRATAQPAPRIEVRRTVGAFHEVHPSTPASPVQCGLANAIVVSTSAGAAVIFQTPTGNTKSTVFSQGYSFSPVCRVGLVVLPAPGFGVALFNLGFDGIGLLIGAEIMHLAGRFTNYWFSPDDSLLVLIGSSGSGSGSGSLQNAAASLYDMVDGSQIGRTEFFTGFVASVWLDNNNQVQVSGTWAHAINWIVP